MPEITKVADNWTCGSIGEFGFEIKHYQNPSRYGIDGGRISKLYLYWKGTYGCVAHYERGWDKVPHFRAAQDAIDTLVTLWN